MIVNRWRGHRLARLVASAKWLRDCSATDWGEPLTLARVDALLEPDRYSARLRGQAFAQARGIHLRAEGSEASTLVYYELEPLYKRPLHSAPQVLRRSASAN